MSPDTDDNGGGNGDDWPWPDSLGALEAAPDSHYVRMENDQVRVVEVVVPPGEKEPTHTHRWPSVMLVDRAARIRYYDGDDEVAYESPERPDGETAERNPPEVEWLDPEGPHAVENVDSVPFHAMRVELKDA